MTDKTTEQLTAEILTSFNITVDAHQRHPKTKKDTIRIWDDTTPYFIHPTWCAMTLLTETSLSESIRFNGYQALFLHDILEDTTIDLPIGTSDAVRRYVQDMTFDSFTDEVNNIWSKDKIVQLLKLYDKTSNLLDAVWMNNETRKRYIDYTLQLTDKIQSEYGDLNIVKISRSIAQY